MTFFSARNSVAKRLALGIISAFLFFAASASMAVAQTSTEGQSAPTGFLQILFSGGIVGGAIILLLLALSLIAAYLVFEQMMTIRRSILMPEGLAESVRSALLASDIAAAKSACEQNPSMLSFVLSQGIGELEFGWAAVEKTLEDALAEQAARLFRKVEYLSLIGNIAPMVGLLGTVIGMILAFQNVASTQGTASAPQLAEGIWSPPSAG